MYRGVLETQYMDSHSSWLELTPMGPVCLDKSRTPASDTAGALCGDRDDAKYPCDEARLWARYRGVLETQYMDSHSSWLGLSPMGPVCLDKSRTPAADTAGAPRGDRDDA